MKQYTQIANKLQARINQHKRDLPFNHVFLKECKGYGNSNGNVYWPLEEAMNRITATTASIPLTMKVTVTEKDDSDAEEEKEVEVLQDLQPTTKLSIAERINQLKAGIARHANNNTTINNDDHTKRMQLFPLSTATAAVPIIINTQVDIHFDSHPTIQALFEELPDMKETEIKLCKRLQVQLKARLHGIEDETQLLKLQGTIRIAAKRLIMLQEHCIVACNDLLVLFAAVAANAVSKKKRKNAIERMLLGASSKLLHLFLLSDDDDDDDVNDEEEEAEEGDEVWDSQHVQRIVESSFIRENDPDPAE